MAGGVAALAPAALRTDDIPGPHAPGSAKMALVGLVVAIWLTPQKRVGRSRVTLREDAGTGPTLRLRLGRVGDSFLPGRISRRARSAVAMAGTRVRNLGEALTLRWVIVRPAPRCRAATRRPKTSGYRSLDDTGPAQELEPLAAGARRRTGSLSQ